MLYCASSTDKLDGVCVNTVLLDWSLIIIVEPDSAWIEILLRPFKLSSKLS